MKSKATLLLFALATLLPSLGMAQQRSNSNNVRPVRFYYGIEHTPNRVTGLNFDRVSRIVNFNDANGQSHLTGDGSPFAPTAPCNADRTLINLRDLTSSLEYKYFVVDVEDNAGLEALGFGSMELEKGEVIVGVEFAQYRRIFSGNAEVRVGIGAILFLKMKKSMFKGGFNLMNVAAQYQKKGQTLQYSILTYGLSGPAVTSCIPISPTFDNSAYTDWLKMVDLLRNLGRQRELEVIVCPELLPIPVESSSRGNTPGGTPNAPAGTR